jgi:hypothetical protein
LQQVSSCGDIGNDLGSRSDVFAGTSNGIKTYLTYLVNPADCTLSAIPEPPVAGDTRLTFIAR